MNSNTNRIAPAAFQRRPILADLSAKTSSRIARRRNCECFQDADMVRPGEFHSTTIARAYVKIERRDIGRQPLPTMAGGEIDRLT